MPMPRAALGERGEAVGGAGRVRDDGVLVGVVEVVVDAHHDGDVLVGGRRRDDDLLGATVVDVGARLGGVGEEAGRLDHDVDVELGPLQVRGVALREDLDDLLADLDLAVGGGDVGVEDTEDRVVLEQVREDRDVGQVVDADDLDVEAGGAHGAEEVAADAAEAVDAYANSHVLSNGRGPLVTLVALGPSVTRIRPYRVCRCLRTGSHCHDPRVR